MDRKMTKGRVSVIIPVYNGVKWIEECINSVLSQTWSNYEIFVMDDHSTDGTTQVVQDMAGRDQRIKLILRNGKGVSAARNEGISLSDGEYITFLDADDKLDCCMLETLIGHLQEEGSDMASCGYYRWSSGMNDPVQKDVSQNSRSDELKNAVITVERGSYVSDYLLHQHTHCWGILYKRSAIGNVKFREDLTIGEDMMFLVDLLPGLSRVSITDYKGYYYRINEAGVTLRPFIPDYMDEIRSWRLAADVIKHDYPQCLPRVESILAVSGILVAGKIAALSGRDRKKYKYYVEECRRTVKEALKVPDAKKNLPAGYGIKTMIFMHWPWGYLKLYHVWKNR